MIAELFYPKELKEVIKDLGIKGDLNEEAIKAINWHAGIKAFIYIAIISFAYSPFEPKFLSLSVIIALTYVIDIRNMANFAVSFSAGEHLLGKVRKIRYVNPLFHWLFPLCFISYEFVNFQNKIQRSKCCLRTKRLPADMSHKGDVIMVYAHPKRKLYNVPFVSHYFKKFCLSKSRLEKILLEEAGLWRN
jgi:hypothetical protein